MNVRISFIHSERKNHYFHDSKRKIFIFYHLEKSKLRKYNKNKYIIKRKKLMSIKRKLLLVRKRKIFSTFEKEVPD
jgi:hypothetical protein